jgi:glucan endo-1,3-alpha-glucosidase
MLLSFLALVHNSSPPFGLLRISIMVSAHAFTRALAVQKSVFAHVIVGNTASHEISTWAQDIDLATAAGIDAFVLNIAYPDPNTLLQVSKAFTAAETSNSSFKLFFSFDYLGGGAPWPAAGENSVISYLNQYKDSKHYFRYRGKPFVSTFEGVNNVQDWEPGGTIRSAVGDLYFVPDWSRLGPQGIKAHLDKIQGAFSWNMWPEGPNNITTSSDEEWQEALGNKSYMMGISPWFFRSASGGKNWIWRGDNLWGYRWAQTANVELDFIQYILPKYSTYHR